mgnify:FL=1
MNATQTALPTGERPTVSKRAVILTALRNFINSRPGLEFANYGDVTSYRADQRSIARAKRDALTLLSAVTWREGIDADALMRAARSAFSGRLSITEREDGRVALEYCAGQYYPTEYRNAACAVLASALWKYTREKAMPAPTYKQHGSATDLPMRTESRYDGLSAGDWLRRYFRREFGATMQRRWFD